MRQVINESEKMYLKSMAHSAPEMMVIAYFVFVDHIQHDKQLEKRLRSRSNPTKREKDKRCFFFF